MKVPSSRSAFWAAEILKLPLYVVVFPAAERYFKRKGGPGEMFDQKKTGAMLKTLRKEKGLTQEQIAEHFNVSSRTVSRWENGINLPDISLLIEISEFYETDLREILSGERSTSVMNEETKETVRQVSEYTDDQKVKTLKKVRFWSVIGLVCMFGVYILMSIPAPLERAYIYNYVLDTCVYIALIVMIYVVLYVNGLLEGIEAKLKSRRLKMALIIIFAAVFIACIVIMYCAISL